MRFAGCSPRRISAHIFVRHSSTTSHASALRNMALVAHIDSGKTTLTESILLKSSYLAASGTVDTGSTTTDFLPVERERGITVQSASIPVKWKDWTFNLIDTPGHADFGMEVESASRVIDGAVVLMDGVEGVESQTKGVWRQLDKYGVQTRMMFINKLDRPGASFHLALRSILAHRLHPNPMPLALPVASLNPHFYATGEPGVEAIVDLVKWNLWKWDQEGQSSCVPLPRTEEELAQTFAPDHPIVPHLLPARAQLLENLSMVAPDLMDTLLALPDAPTSCLEVDSATIIGHLRTAALNNEILPVLCGSALKHVGTEMVMDYVGELFPNPLDRPHPPQQQSSPLQMLAWKVVWDEKKGWMTFVRIYSGTLTRQVSLLNKNRNQKEKVGKLMLLYASEAKEVETLPFGSVGVILGLKYTRTGDTLVSAGAAEPFQSTLREISPPPAVVSTAVIPHSHSDLQPVQDALHALSRTDPSVRVDVQEGQTLVHGLGSLHLEIVEGRLKDTWRVNFEFGKRFVSYREGLGFSEPSDDWMLWRAEVNGKPISVKVPLKIRAMEEEEEGDRAWDNNVVIDHKGRGVPPPDPTKGSQINYIAEGILNAICASPHSSLPLTGLHITVGDLSVLNTRVPSIVTGAAASVTRRRVKEAGMGPILEPFVNLKISMSESSLGKVVKNITEHGGEILDMGEGSLGQDDHLGYPEDGVYMPPAWLSPSGRTDSSRKQSLTKRSVHAVAPLSQFLDYSNRLRAMSEGHGNFEMTPAGFRQVGEARKMEILREIGRA